MSDSDYFGLPDAFPSGAKIFKWFALLRFFSGFFFFIRIVQKIDRLFVYKAKKKLVDNPIGLW